MWGEGEFGNSQWGDPKGVVAFSGIERVDGFTPRSFDVTCFEADGADITPPEGIIYELHVGLAPALPFAVRAMSAAGVLKTTITELKPGITYYVRARARGIDSGLSVESEEHEARTLLGAPIVGNQVPAPGSLLTRQQPVAFDVTDESGVFRRILIHVKYSNGGATEVVHNGDVFETPYTTASRRTTIAGGYRYSVLRSGGWPTAPTFIAYPIDLEGVEA